MTDMDVPRSLEWTYDIRRGEFTWSSDLRQAIDLGVGTGKFDFREYLSHVHPHDRENFIKSFKGAIETEGLFDIEYRLIDSRGTERSVLQFGIAAKEHKGGPTRIRGILREVTGLISLNKELSESCSRIATLESEVLASRKSLQEFISHASHDLRAPLRSICGLSEIVLEKNSDKLDEQAKAYLGRMAAQARRLSRMLDDLQILSRITNHPINWQPLDLSQIASETVGKIRKNQTSCGCDFSIQPGMKSIGDLEDMERVMGCLLDNAVKFSSTRPTAKIEFGMRSVDGERYYFIRDNGVGFNMTYIERLFLPFQRLHSEEEFPGTGMGLAIAAAIIHKHGGRIWAESNEGEGATFFFVIGEPARVPGQGNDDPHPDRHLQPLQSNSY